MDRESAGGPGLRRALDRVFSILNKRRYVHPDPLEFLYSFDNPADREIAGLVASSLALGRVRQILASVSAVLKELNPPFGRLMSSTDGGLRSTFRGFRHRFAAGSDLAAMLSAARTAIEECGSLRMFFLRGFSGGDQDVLPALSAFALGLRGRAGGGRNALLPDPRAGSAMKRLNLFLRWMVRSDEVDPGGWAEIPRSKLIVPLDTHMHGIGKLLGFTKRAQADMRTALETTAGFSRIAPEDPVKYDFALTRIGIRKDCSGLIEELSAFGGARAAGPRRKKGRHDGPD